MKKISYEKIPQSPREFLKFRTLTNSLGKAEAEELLHRILLFCLEKDCWVAPTADELDAQVYQDLYRIDVANEIINRNLEKRKIYKKKARWNWLRKLFGIEVIMEPKYEEELEIPQTILVVNPDAMIVGAAYMLEKEFLKFEKDGEEMFFRVTQKALLTMPIVKQ